MQAIDRYRLEPHDGPYEHWPGRSRLLVDGAASAHFVPGYVIEAQYRTRLGGLLITSFDCPFEESNRFVLLDDDHRCTAEAELLAPYASFLLHEHWAVDAHTLALHYHGQLFYLLSLQPPAGWWRRRPRLRLRRCLSWKSEPRMVQSHEALQRSLQAVATPPA